MDTKQLRFLANRPWLNEASTSAPRPIAKTIPEWYRDADRFARNPETGQHWQLPDGGGKIPTWKACPAMFDVMGSGYALLTPCDIEFFEDSQGLIQGRVLDPQQQNFLYARDPLPQFVAPPGYHARHFAWWPDWALELPPGYSALYTQPVNRFELPFLTTNGIVDNDMEVLPSTMPFFFVQGMSGILPAGTPYAQIFPFLREDWVAEYEIARPEEAIAADKKANSEKFRQPDGGVYLREVWERRKYQ